MASEGTGLTTAIACASGSIRGVFVHGVLAGLEQVGFRADAYAASSSSAVPAAFAAIGEVGALDGVAYWKEAGERYKAHGNSMSEAILDGLTVICPLLAGKLFTASTARYVVVTSEVVDTETAAQTQGDGARKLGQRLVISTRQRDRGWADANLATRLFDNRSSDPDLLLRPDDLADILYATTRILHAWKVPAWIRGRPHIDASYTCSCPAVELAELGYDRIIAVLSEPGTPFRDFFQASLVPDSWKGRSIQLVQPDAGLGEWGVDYMSATDEGLEQAFAHGLAKGRALATSSPRRIGSA
jgi:hypothetical protein